MCARNRSRFASRPGHRTVLGIHPSDRTVHDAGTHAGEMRRADHALNCTMVAIHAHTIEAPNGWRRYHRAMADDRPDAHLSTVTDRGGTRERVTSAAHRAQPTVRQSMRL